MIAPFAIPTLTRNLLVLAVALFLVAGNGACRRGASRIANANGMTSAASEAESERSKREAQTLVDQGKELYKNDQDGQAAEAFQQAIKLNPDLAEAHLRLGMAYAALERKPESDESYKKAVELFKKRIQADSKDADAFFNLGLAQSLLHQDEDAVRAFRQATRLKSDNEEAFYQLGMSEIRLAHYPEAISALQKALELDPEDYRATDALETAKEGATRIKEGKKHAEEMLKKQQENANANGSLNTNSSAKPTPKRPPSKPW
jgi:tetratricopeptide (TPR) repeat protein